MISDEIWDLIEDRKKLKTRGRDNENQLTKYNQMTKVINKV